MKKVLSIILVLTLVFALGVTALAVDPAGTTGNTRLTTEVTAAYEISIPDTKAITYGDTTTNLPAIKLTKVNLGAGAKINVALTAPSGTTNTYKLTNTNGDEIAFAVNSGVNAFTGANLSNLTDQIVLAIVITEAAWKTAPAGDYTGTVSFTVSYVPPTVP